MTDRRKNIKKKGEKQKMGKEHYYCNKCNRNHYKGGKIYDKHVVFARSLKSKVNKKTVIKSANPSDLIFIKQHGWQPKDQYAFPVKRNFTAYIRSGSKPSNAYYGSSQIQETTYKEITVKKGDILINLHGKPALCKKSGQSYIYHQDVRSYKPNFRAFSMDYGDKSMLFIQKDFGTQIPYSRIENKIKFR